MLLRIKDGSRVLLPIVIIGYSIVIIILSNFNANSSSIELTEDMKFNFFKDQSLTDKNWSKTGCSDLE